MYTIRKEFHFSSSHVLEGLSPNHPCSRLHGHNYIVIVELQAKKLNDVGMVVDYRELEPIKKWLDERFDHQHLNDRVNYNPTAENLAAHIYLHWKEFYPELVAVEVLETPKTRARYEPA